MKVEDFINKEKVVDLSFFNFENAITAAYYANENLEIQKTNKNFAKFFPILGNVTNAYFPNVLEQLGIPEEQIAQFKSQIDENGSVLIPQIKITLEGKERMFSLLSARTKNKNFSYFFNFISINNWNFLGIYFWSKYFYRCTFRYLLLTFAC